MADFKNLSLDELFEKLDEIESKLYAFSYSSSQINFAGETQDPAKAAKDRGEALAVIGELYHNTLVSSETKELLDELGMRKDEISGWRADQIRVLSRDYAQSADIPAKEDANFTRLVVEANDVWHKAKETDDWDLFAPYIDKIVATLVKFAEYKDPTKNAYDVWLNEYEEGTDREFYNKFFEQLKATIVPLIAKIQEEGWQPSRECIEVTCDKENQLKLSYDVAVAEGVDMDKLVIEESLHPFTDSVSSNHAFVTTHIFENDVTSNMFSMLHECGHAMYELGVDEKFNYTSLRGGTSMGIHESVSRFYENIVGRDFKFAKNMLELAKKRFPSQFKDTSAYDFYFATNIATPSLIRTEADELTYSLHCIIRYEIEQDLFAGTITAKDVPSVWAEKYKQYLGVDVPNNAEGALQDTHWSGGSFGYFPTYALGSAYGAQYKAAMIEQGINFDECLTTGNLTPINEWMEENIWKWGRSRTPEELLIAATGQTFDAKYFCDYLEDKFSEIYGL